VERLFNPIGRRVLILILASAVLTASAWAEPGVNPKLKMKKIGPDDVRENVGPEESPMGRYQASIDRMGGELSPAFIQHLYKEGAKVQNGANAIVGDEWQSLGPTDTTRFQNGINKPEHDTGRMRTILVHPDDLDKVWLLTSSGGMWRTENFGANKPNWTVLTDEIFGAAGGFAAFGCDNGEVDPGTVHMGTGDPFDLGPGGAVFKSNNRGDSWSAPFMLPNNIAAARPPQRVMDLKVDCAGSNGDDDYVVLVGTDAGLYRSTDGGASFVSISVDPLVESWYAAPPDFGYGHEVWSLVKTDAGWLASQGYFQLCTNCIIDTIVYVSLDGGATWTEAGPPFNFDSYLNFETPGRTTLAALGDNEGVVYALSSVAVFGQAQDDVYRSDDGGLSWAATDTNSSSTPTNPNLFNPDMDIIAGQGYYNQAIVVDPSDDSGDTVHIGGQLGTAVTRDGGASWTLTSGWLGKYNNGLRQFGEGYAVNLPYVHADQHTSTIAVVGKKKRIYFGHDGGVSYSNDNAKSFKDNANQGLVTNMIYALTAGTKHPEQTLIGLQDNGTRFRVGNSTRWTGSIGGDGFGVGWSQANNDFAMGSVYFLDIRRWANPPPNNQAKYDQLLGTSNLAGPGGAWEADSAFYTPIVTPTVDADSTGGLFYTHTDNYILKTGDGGDSWEAVIDMSADDRNMRGTSHGMGLSPNNPDNFGLAAAGGWFISTTDGGATRNDVEVASAGIPSWPGYNAAAALCRDNSTYFLGSESPLVASVGVGPYLAKSTDGGANWVDSTNDLPLFPINKILVDPADETCQRVYVANWVGVYFSDDGGASWSRLGEGLPFAMASDLYLPPDGRFLRISTYGRGVWELALD
jgi:hypothetical protein